MAWQYAALAGFQLAQGFMQAENVKKQAALQKEIDDFNIGLAKFDAWKAEADGQAAVALYQQQVEQANATAKVRAAAVGADIKSGSLAQVQRDNDLTALSNSLSIQNQAAEKAMGYRRQVSGIQAQSAINYGAAQAQAQNMIIGSALNAASTGIKAYGSQYTPSTTGQDTSPSSPSGYTYEPLGGSATKGTGYLGNFSFID